MPNVFIVNVFANASHPFVNPLFEDSSFEVVPIPEKYKGSWIKKYRDLRCFHTGEPLTKYLPNRYHNRHVHDDPDLVNMTYGDGKSPRSGNLEKIMRSDWAVFYALLTPFKNGRPFRKSRAFYIVSAFEVENTLRKFPHVTGSAGKRQRRILNEYGRKLGKRILENAHTRRWLQDPSFNDNLRMIIIGGPKSRRFDKPFLMTRSFCNRFFKDKSGNRWNWDKKKSDLQTIGSYLRSVRSAERPNELIGLLTNSAGNSGPRLYSYIVAHDTGFAPCVKGGILSLACCKPRIRSTAKVGDWILGTTPKRRGSGKVVFLMKVTDKMTFADYYRRFAHSKRKDAIYRLSSNGTYRQLKNPNHGPKQKSRDLSVDAVLLSKDFTYFGRNVIGIPKKFQTLITDRQGHKMSSDAQFVRPFLDWASSLRSGVQGPPADAEKC